MSYNSFFPEIPLMEAPRRNISELVHYGAGNMVVTIENTTKEDYSIYLKQLEDKGLELYVNNEEGLGDTVFHAIYRIKKWVVTVTFMGRTGKTYISTCFDLPLSEHLLFRDQYVAENKVDEQTKIHMLEMYQYGNSFVIQLKNGHFIVSDGGTKEDAPYLLDYLESLTPEGEKPVIEAWIITHCHYDHCGIMGGFFDEPQCCERMYVEGFYFNEPNDSVTQLDVSGRIMMSWIKAVAGEVKTTKGTHPEIYRPQTGQRYYFSDITMDIIHAQEQLLREDYSGDINDSSTWCMFTIEGQKCLFGGDGESGCMSMLMRHYTKEYLDVDVFTLLHHGFNTSDSFTDYCKVKTLLITTKDLPVRRANENIYLKEQVEEYFSWEDGAKVMSFPYNVGSYQSLAPIEWIYHKGRKRPVQPNAYVYTTSNKYKEIRSLRPINDNGYTEYAENLVRRIEEQMPIQYRKDGMLIELCIDDTLKLKEGYEIRFDKFSGWIIVGKDEIGLSCGIDAFIDNANWNETGFVPKELF